MKYKKKYQNDYRVNTINENKIISIEVTCCGKHIGEVRFKDGESLTCPLCHTSHALKLQHNHFHIRPSRTGQTADTGMDSGLTPPGKTAFK